MTAILTDQIDRLRAAPLDGGRRWRVTFRSGHEGLCHQLYLNGELAGWTDAPAARSFLVDAADVPREVVVAAVEPDQAGEDHAADLPAGPPAWRYEAAVPRLPDVPAGARLTLLGDRAGAGQAVLSTREAWPASVPRWAFGQDAFGAGAFGYDGAAAPGLGGGAFGAGLFGFGAGVVRLAAALAEDGTHQLRLRLSSADGRSVETVLSPVTVHPPPEPPASVECVSYDPQTHVLTAQVH